MWAAVAAAALGLARFQVAAVAVAAGEAGLSEVGQVAQVRPTKDMMAVTVVLDLVVAAAAVQARSAQMVGQPQGATVETVYRHQLLAPAHSAAAVVVAQVRMEQVLAALAEMAAAVLVLVRLDPLGHLAQMAQSIQAVVAVAAALGLVLFTAATAAPVSSSCATQTPMQSAIQAAA